MQITHSDIEKLARMAKLKLSAAEMQAMETDLGDIFALVDQLNEVDTSRIEPTSQVTGLSNVTRPDVDNYTFAADDMAATMPDVTDDGYLRVHALFKKD